LCLSDLAQNYEIDLPFSIEAFIRSTTAEKIVDRLLERMTSNELDAFSIPINKITLLSPIASPPKILYDVVCDDKNLSQSLSQRI
jgi:hypothetical protein